ncbi:hypothetical protein HPB48_022682 [Haemaphysalis longicornis]|uniref:Uncharacterized protein n=1 Tax=Haemaphysalis longicornis TaxID=44386 RepID=A0A9J6GH51_HAELO|nr:hypothetical protein HPB48_022682 [Haemaphysalis longicornis]
MQRVTASGRSAVSVWGVVTAESLGPLVRIENRLIRIRTAPSSTMCCSHTFFEDHFRNRTSSYSTITLRYPSYRKVLSCWRVAKWQSSNGQHSRLTSR